MNNIAKRIFDLIQEEDFDFEFLVQYLDLSDVSIIYTWKRDEYLPSTENAIKLSELFNCSIDYLLCRTEECGKFSKNQVDSFYNRVEFLIKKKELKKINLEKEKICSSNNLFKWKRGAVPKIETLIKLADYFSVSIDYLLGKE